MWRSKAPVLWRRECHKLLGSYLSAARWSLTVRHATSGAFRPKRCSAASRVPIMESKVADLTLADAGRLEIQLAETEMPGLMQIRKDFGESKPLAGARITGSLHATVQTAVLVETLKHLGADLRWCSCNIFSTQDQAAAALVERGSCALFAWKGETIEDYWWCTLQALTWPEEHPGPILLIDDGGDATLLIHEGVLAEQAYIETGILPNPEDAENNVEKKAILALLRDTLKQNPSKWRTMVRC